jgi:hypothetical protein
MRWKAMLVSASQSKNIIKVASKMVGETVEVYITTLMATSSKEIGKTIKKYRGFTSLEKAGFSRGVSKITNSATVR